MIINIWPIDCFRLSLVQNYKHNNPTARNIDNKLYKNDNRKSENIK